MKSRTSFFDRTVLRKDITRFAPLWGLYLIGGLLIAISVAAGSSTYYLGQALNNLIGPFSIISLCYAIVAAQLLFGDLFNTRLCNALHAMPLRREGWFLTHVTAGMLYSLVPNLIISLALMPFLGEFWYTALIWLLGMELHYLFFFGLAVFCMMLTGNRFAAAAVYAIINALSAIAMWFCNTIFAPMLYGVVIRTAAFAPWCPVWALCGKDDFFTIAHSDTCPCLTYGGYEGYFDSRCAYDFAGFGESWGYLILLAVLGIALGAAALVLYRKRHLESAGDFMAFKRVKPVFAIVYTLCVGALLQIIGNLFDDPMYIFLLIGLIVGYFTSQMLLNRTLRVFKKKNWLAMILILVLIFGSVGLCRIDAFGLISWTPDVEDVVSVKVADSRVSEFRPSNTDAEFTDKANIEKLISIHELLYAEGPTDSRDHYDGLQNVTICYKLKDGREIYRQYKATVNGKSAREIDNFIFCNPVYVLHAGSLETLLSGVQDIFTEGMYITGQRRDQLLTALWADGQAGTLRSDGKWDEGSYIGYVQIQYKDGASRYLDIFDTNKHTADWFRKELLLGVGATDLKNNIGDVTILGVVLDWGDPQRMEAFCDAFAKDLGAGIVEGHGASGYPVLLTLHSGSTYKYTVTEKAETCYNWIKENIPTKP